MSVFGELVESAKSIEIRAWRGPLDLSASDKEFYSAIGYFTSQVAGLEFLLDECIFLIARKCRRLAHSLSKKIPFKMKEKIDFLIWTLVSIPKLREIGDSDGFLNLNFIGYAFEELWDFRNYCIHGNIGFINIGEDNFMFRSSRYSRADGHNSFMTTYEIRKKYIEMMLDNNKYLKSMIFRIIDILNGKDLKKELDEVMRGRAMIREIEAHLGRSIFSSPEA